MAARPSFTGAKILVVEDDYLLATDAAAGLAEAGAEVLGPCANEAAAFRIVAETRPSAAVLDINLQGGRSFGLARDLHAARIPFVFITGYDDVIPAEFDTTPRLRKPISLAQLLHAVGALLADA